MSDGFGQKQLFEPYCVNSARFQIGEEMIWLVFACNVAEFELRLTDEHNFRFFKLSAS